MKIPANLSFDQATVPVAATMAAAGLHNPTGANLVPPWEEGGREKHVGKPILIVGGSSSVGQYGEFFC